MHFEINLQQKKGENESIQQELLHRSRLQKNNIVISISYTVTLRSFETKW